MARKKAVTEPQEEQMQDTAVPAEGMDGAEPDPMEDAPSEGMGQGPVDSVPDGAILADNGEGSSGEFPAGDDMPFEGVSDGEVLPQDAVPGEPPAQDGLPPGDGEAGMDDAPGGLDREGDGEDYDALLAAVSQGGMEPVPLPEDEGDGEADMDGEGQDSSPGEMPPVAPENQLNDLPPAPDTSGGEDNFGMEGGSVSHRVVDRRTSPRRERERVLTIDPRAEVMTQQDLNDLVWHELENAQRTGHILTGKLSGVERTPLGMDLAVIIFKGVRVLVPLKEMGVHTGPVPSGLEYTRWAIGIVKILSSRQNFDVDFLVRGFGAREDNGERFALGSRRDAMRRKRKRFYLDTDELGSHLIEEGSLVQARVVAVAEKSVRLEVFGVECAVSASGVSRLWVSSVRSKYAVGDLITVRVTKIERTSGGDVAIRVDARDVFGDEADNLHLCQRNGRYVGEVTGINKGVFFIRLDIGVNAVSHECRDMRMPGRKDTVSLTVTRLDEKNGVALGIINRIIKQNL